jgi:acyl-CoA thioester hydrolase/thioesterase-3
MTSKFESVIKVLPRDIDINGHVHHSVYLDYLLAARYDQMDRCYGMSMDAFFELGYTWVARRYEIMYKTPVVLGDDVVVRTWVEAFGKFSVEIRFEMESHQTGRCAARGSATYVLLDLKSNKPARLPETALTKYSV